MRSTRNMLMMLTSGIKMEETVTEPLFLDEPVMLCKVWVRGKMIST